MDNSSDTTHAVQEDPTAMVASDIVNNLNSSNATVQPGPRTLRARPSLFTLHEPSIVLDLTGANIRLQIGNTVIKTHERRLEKFARLRELIKEARQENAQSDTLTIILDGNKQLVEDFRNMFELINASSIDQADCKVATLVSAARIAAPSAYGYEPLYHHCIDKLEGLSLSPMERIRVARALGNELWEKAACEDLSRRKELITKEEAQTLGLDAYWRIASDREKRKGVTFERMLEGIQDATRAVLAAKQQSMPVLRANKRETITTIAPGVTNNRGLLKDTTEGRFSTVHDLTGANIHLQVNSVVIKTNENRISKFAHLNSLIQAARNANPQSDTLTITLQGDEKLASDFLNTFELLSSWSIEKPGNFEFQTLLSAALISATCGNPTLLAFCVKQLEGFPLSQVQRLDIGRRLDIKSWREGVYREMISRDTIITKEEALALGIDAHWFIANARESHNRNVERGLWIILTVVFGLWVICLGLAYVYWPQVPKCGV